MIELHSCVSTVALMTTYVPCMLPAFVVGFTQTLAPAYVSTGACAVDYSNEVCRLLQVHGASIVMVANTSAFDSL